MFGCGCVGGFLGFFWVGLVFCCLLCGCRCCWFFWSGWCWLGIVGCLCLFGWSLDWIVVGWVGLRVCFGVFVVYRLWWERVVCSGCVECLDWLESLCRLLLVVVGRWWVGLLDCFVGLELECCWVWILVVGVIIVSVSLVWVWIGWLSGVVGCLVILFLWCWILYFRFWFYLDESGRVVVELGLVVLFICFCGGLGRWLVLFVCWWWCLVLFLLDRVLG